MFIAYVNQGDEGCDYTIGCAQTLWRLEANTRDEAIEELKSEVIGKYEPGFGWSEGYWKDAELSKVVLFEVSSEESMPLVKWYTDAEEYELQEKTKITEMQERDKLGELLAKYGK